MSFSGCSNPTSLDRTSRFAEALLRPALFRLTVAKEAEPSSSQGLVCADQCERESAGEQRGSSSREPSLFELDHDGPRHSHTLAFPIDFGAVAPTNAGDRQNDGVRRIRREPTVDHFRRRTNLTGEREAAGVAECHLDVASDGCRSRGGIVPVTSAKKDQQACDRASRHRMLEATHPAERSRPTGWSLENATGRRSDRSDCGT